MQKMECHYLEDDILSKIPQINENNIIHQNLEKTRLSDNAIVLNQDYKATAKLEEKDSTKNLYGLHKVTVLGVNDYPEKEWE